MGWACVCFSFGGTRYDDDDDDELVLARRGHSVVQVFKSQTCERACICLHTVVVMQALMTLAENVLLYTSDCVWLLCLPLHTVKQNNLFIVNA